MKEGIIKDTYEAVIKEIQTILTVSYVLAIGIGMLFNYQKFSEFGINIFDYADVFDFLIAPFSDFIILLFIVGSLTITYVLFSLDQFMKRRFPKAYSKQSFGWDKKKWYEAFRYISYLILFIFYLYSAADKYGEVLKEQMTNQSSIQITFFDNEIKEGKMIGKTKDVIFLLSCGKVEAIPITSLVKGFEISQ